MYHINLQVVSRETIRLLLVEEQEFWLYIHDEGEEFFLHYDYWPNIPFTYKSSGDTFWEEFGIQKQLQIKSSEDVCMEQNYDYFGKHCSIS